MKKILLGTLCSIVAASTLFANILGEVEEETFNKIKQLEFFKNQKGIKIKDIKQNKDLYIISIALENNAKDRGNVHLYLTKSMENLISGDVINLKNMQKVVIPEDISFLEDKEAFSFGTGKDEYIFFTDPECPYCKKFEKGLTQIEDKIKVKVFFYPLPFHKNAKDLSIFAMSNKGKEFETLLNTTAADETYKNKKWDEKEKEELTSKINEQIELAGKLNVAGTPTVFNSNGERIDWPVLLLKYGVNINEL